MNETTLRIEIDNKKQLCSKKEKEREKRRRKRRSNNDCDRFLFLVRNVTFLETTKGLELKTT